MFFSVFAEHADEALPYKKYLVPVYSFVVLINIDSVNCCVELCPFTFNRYLYPFTPSIPTAMSVLILHPRGREIQSKVCLW